jgi:DNA-binding SARP family transcriptional activator
VPLGDPVIRLQALGSVELSGPGGRELKAVLSRPKLLGLLAYLAASAAGRFHRRDTLVGLLWPESTDERARNALRQAVYQLRNELGEGVLVGRGDEELGLDAERFWSDVAAFEAALEAGNREGALELYRGDLLAGLYVTEAPAFETWLEDRRANLRRRAAAAARALAERARGDGNAAAAGRWGRRALELAPLDETLVREVIGLLSDVGDRAGAVQEYDSFARRLKAQMDVGPAPETEALARAIRARGAGVPPALASHEGAQPLSGGRLAAPPLTADLLGPAAMPRLEASPWARLVRTPRVVAAAVGVAAVAVAATLVVRGRAPDLQWGRVALGVFENRTGDSTLDAVGHMVAGWTAGALRRSRLAEVPDPDLSRQAVALATLRREADERTRTRIVAEATGARLVVSGTVYLVGDTLLLDARVTDAERQVVLAQLDPVRALRADPAPAVVELSSRIAGAIGTIVDVSVRSIADAPRQPPTYEAYRAFAAAEDMYNRAAIPGQFRLHEEAYRRFLGAYALDSNIVEALMRAADAALFLGLRPAAESLAARVSLRRERLSPWAQVRLDILNAKLSGDLEGWLRAARSARDTPLDLAEAALATNRPREAVDALTSGAGETWLRSFAGLGWQAFEQEYWSLLTSAYHALGEYRTELGVARRERSRSPADIGSMRHEARALAALGRVRDVERLLDASPSIAAAEGPPAGNLMATTAWELRAHGQPEAAQRAAERAVAWYDSRSGATPPDVQGRLIALFAAARWDEMLPPCESLAVERPRALAIQGILGLLAARRGDREEARRRSDGLAALVRPGDRNLVLYWRAGIAAHLGDLDAAMSLLRDAVAAGYPQTTRLHSDGVLEPLWGSEAFREFLRPRG